MGVEEKKDNFENIKIINNLYKEGAHISALNETKSIIKGVSKKITEKARLLALAKKEEKAKQEEVVEVQEEVKVVETPEIKVEEVKPTETVEVKAEEKVKETTPKKEEVKPTETVEVKAEEKPTETAPKTPVIEKTANPNIFIVDGKRVFIPQNKQREFINKDGDKKPRQQGEKKPFNKGDKKPLESSISDCLTASTEP